MRSIVKLRMNVNSLERAGGGVRIASHCGWWIDGDKQEAGDLIQVLAGLSPHSKIYKATN